MEFRLNKIDPEVRKQVNDATKEGKIHRMDHKLSINKDKNSGKDKEKKQVEQNMNKKILVDVVKNQVLKIDAFIEENSNDKITKGKFLDIRK